MNAEKHKELNSLKNKKNNLLNENNLLNKRPLSGKQLGLYVLGLYGTTITSSLLFPNITLLAIMIPLVFAGTTPIIMINKNKKKSKKLEIEINDLNNQIIEIENELSKEENNMGDINKIEEILKHPELQTECPVRIRIGKFYTDEEYEQRREEVLSRPLPGEEDRPKLVKSIYGKNNKKI